MSRHEHHLTWANFRTSVAAPTGVFTFAGRPMMQICVADDLCVLRVACQDPAADSPFNAFSALQVENGVHDGTPLLLLILKERPLLRQFYQVCLELAEHVQDTGLSVEIASHRIVEDWRALLNAEHGSLSPPQQRGLWAELEFLRRLLDAHRSNAVEFWRGPTRDPHDFRLGNVEFEIKSTASASRIHTISSLSQLQPTHGCYLYLVSYMLASGVGGKSLPTMVAEIRRQLEPSPAYLRKFEHMLDAARYYDEDAEYYRELLRLRGRLALMQVNEQTPRIGIPTESTARFRRIHYDFDVAGLAIEQDDAILAAFLREVVHETK